MSENEQTTVQINEQVALETAERIANQLNEENAALRAQLAERPITVEEQSRRHGDELLGILTGPNTGGGTEVGR